MAIKSCSVMNRQLLTIVPILLFALILFFSSTYQLLAQDGWCNQAILDEWQLYYGQTVPPAPAHIDFNGDKKIDGLDYVHCITNWDYGSEPTAEQPIATVQQPQPTQLQATPLPEQPQPTQLQVTPLPEQPQPTQNLNPVPSVVAPVIAPATNTPIPFDAGSPVPVGANSVLITAPGLNIRSGPGTQYAIVGTTAHGGHFALIGQSANGWFNINWIGGSGWISAAFSQVVSSSTSSPVPTVQSSGTPVPLAIGQNSPVPSCPSGTGPGGIPAGSYPADKLSQDQRQWLFAAFGNSGQAPVGYGGQDCTPSFGSTDDNFAAFICRRAERGPGGILPGGYAPQSLTHDQRQWLFEQFGNRGIAPEGYGGRSCPVNPVPQCPSGVGPGGITAGSFPAESLTQEQRQWLWNIFSHSGTAPVGYGGEACVGGQGPLRACPPGVGQPGSFDPASLTQQQRNDLFHAFGHQGEAPVGYGGEPCWGGSMTLPSFVTSTPRPLNPSSTPTPISPVSTSFPTGIPTRPPSTPQPVPTVAMRLGKNCSDNGNGTATCTAIGVNTNTGNPSDPYAAIFEMPNDAQWLNVRFYLRGFLINPLGGPCPAHHESWDGYFPSPGFSLWQGCVKGIEYLPGTDRDNPANWTLTYRP